MENHLRAIRKSRQLSQGGLSRISGVSVFFISRIENGKAPGVSVEIALKLCAALNCSVEDLFKLQ